MGDSRMLSVFLKSKQKVDKGHPSVFLSQSPCRPVLLILLYL